MKKIFIDNELNRIKLIKDVITFVIIIILYFINYHTF